MKLKAGQIWALEDANENVVKVLDVAKVHDNGTFTGGFHAVENPSDFAWREEVPESEILDNKLWKPVGALYVVEVLRKITNLRKFVSEALDKDEQEEKTEEHAECSAIVYLFNSKDECAGVLKAENIHCTPVFRE